MLQAVNLLKLFSIALFLCILSLVYAYLPVMVRIWPEGTELMIHKEPFFYYAIGCFLIVNLALLAFQKLIEKRLSDQNLMAWLRGFTFVINLYFTFIAGFIGVINNTGQLNPSGFAYLNYLGPVLVFCWVAGFIYLVLIRTKTA